MPDCYRCNRTFPTAELRRTTKGHVCKDGASCKRRLSQLRATAGSGPAGAAREAAWNELRRAASQTDPLTFLRASRDLNDRLAEAAIAVCERAVRETNVTQAQLARALDVTPSTLTGLRRTAA